MKNYDHNKIEKKWQKDWDKKKIYKTLDSSKKPKYYVLDMFPYLSGEGLHVGHPKGYIATDVISRMKRMQGANVMHPMGFDAFGLPAENYALKTKTNPAVSIPKNVIRFKKQLEILGFDYDWSREVNTTDPKYYKWTQWIFLKLLEKGLAYESYEPINWCPSCKTGLANEDVEDGKCERCGTMVEQKPMRQWVLRITDYAERLLKDLDQLDWPESIKESQKNWIGKSEGSEIDFKISYGSWISTDLKLSKKTLDLYELKKELDKFIKENNLKATYSGGFALMSHVGNFYRNHDDIDLCPLDSNSFSKISEFLVNKKFKIFNNKDKDSAYFLTFLKGNLRIDLIQIGIDSKKGIYDMEKGKPDYWGFREKEIINNENFSYLSPKVVIKLKFLNNQKDILDKKIISFGSRTSMDFVKVFTTRADTIFGATYVVLAPEHELVNKLKAQILNWGEVENYIKEVKDRPDIERTAENKTKTGVELKGVKAINPANGEEIPIWIADYVLASYGTGAVMAVPAHDERDFLFAKKYNLEIRNVVDPFFVEEINKEAPMVERNAISAIVKHWSEDKYIGLKWKKADWGTFITGGIEEGQTAEQAARMEIEEETGYFNLKLIKKLPNTHSKFYHLPKKENRFAHFTNFYFELINDEQKEISNKEKEKHSLVWLNKNEVEKFITPEGQRRDWKLVQEKEFAYTDFGILANSEKFNGLESNEAIKKITDFVGGKMVTKYKLRDWVFSRQRYWGEPIPVLHDGDKIIPIKEKDLPVILPKVKFYEPTGTGESPLANIPNWVNIKVGKGKNAKIMKRETNTMPQWAGSSWYYLRYMDPKNDKALVDKKKEKYWNQVDFYVGGAEHATRHLIYARFWHKFLYDIGVVSTLEPFKKLQSVGLIIGEDGRKMSKRFGNIVNPDDIVKTYGADTLRLYEMFMGPFDQTVVWNTNSIIGPRRFLEKVWRIGGKVGSSRSNLELSRGSTSSRQENSVSFQTILHKTIKKITEDIESMNFNTAVSSMMVLVNEMEKTENISIKDFKMFLQILAPFAPHITEELWTNLGEKKSIHKSPWPKWDKKKIIDDQVRIAIQVNGKVRSEISVNKDIKEEEIKILALKDKNVLIWVGNKEIRRFIYIPGRIVNIVV